MNLDDHDGAQEISNPVIDALPRYSEELLPDVDIDLVDIGADVSEVDEASATSGAGGSSSMPPRQTELGGTNAAECMPGSNGNGDNMTEGVVGQQRVCK